MMNALTSAGWPNSIAAFLCALLIGALVVGPLGCGTLLGYGIGRNADLRHFAGVPAPFEGSLPLMSGRIVRVTGRDGRVITGKLLGIEQHSGTGAVCTIEVEHQTGRPRPPTSVDTVGTGTIAVVEVAGDSYHGRTAGLFFGTLADVGALYLLKAELDRYAKAD